MKLIFGCGYLGSRVARLWQARGDRVAVVTRSIMRAAEFEAAGYLPIIADVTSAASLVFVSELAENDTVLYSVGFDRASGKSRREVHVEGLRNVLDVIPAGVRRLLYISTTSVYGQNDGSWIDEQSPCQPTSEGGRAYLEAESLLSSHAIGARAIILRMAGIYGPQRIPHREDLMAGKPLAVAAESYLNLIHVDDAARIVLAVEGQTQPPRVYLVADGHPVVRREYYAEAARLLAAPRPVFVNAYELRLSESRGNTSKRINNARLTTEIDFQFQYRTYKEGLPASIDNRVQ